VRQLDQLESVRLENTTPTQARFSPDGSSVAFVTGGRLRRVALDGTPPVTLVPDSVEAWAGISWGSDDMIYFVKTEVGIWRIPADGGAPEPVTMGFFPEALPGLNAILFTQSPIAEVNESTEEPGTRRIAALNLESQEVFQLLEGSVARYARSGHVVYTAPGFGDGAGTLLAAAFDLRRLEVTGPSTPILDGLRVDVNGYSEFAVSESGTLVYRPGGAGPGEAAPVWLGVDGSEEVLDPRLSADIEALSISPDGTKIAFDRAARTEIWVYDRTDGTSSLLTSDGILNARPTWSPDGAEVGFISTREGRSQAFYARPWDHSGPARLLRAPVAGSIIWEGLWTPDGDRLIYRGLPRSGLSHILHAAAHPDSAPTAIVENESFKAALSLSPDGRWLAYQSNESGRDEVYVRPFPGPGGRSPVSVDGGQSPIWANDGEILYTSGDSWVMATVRTEPEFAVERRDVFGSTEGFATLGLIQTFDISSDDGRILALRTVPSGSNFRDVVVQNFFAELNRIVPPS